MSFECVSIGDAVMDVYLTLHEAEVNCKINKEDCVICFPYGDKIPVDRMDWGLGGNAMNNVVALARLGFKTALFSMHGDDEIGQQFDRALDKEGVDRTLVTSVPQTQSRYSTIINYLGERTILEYWVPHVYRLPQEFPQTKWVYVSSVGESYEDFFHALVTLSREKNIKLAFNPNNKQLNSPLESYEALIRSCDLVFMNVEEAKKMLGKQLGEEKDDQGVIKNLLSEIYDLGVKIVAITNGKDGSYSYDGTKYRQMRTLDWPVVSVTGAGDAYASGFMAAIMKGLPTEQAMRWGTVNSASVIGKYGPHTGTLKLDEMARLTKENENLRAVEI